MIARRLLHLSLSLAVGMIALVALGAALNPVARAATNVTRTFPDVAPCATTLQACIDASASGDVILIKPGTYVTSIMLPKPVSLIGLGTITPTILIAPANQRIILITSASITASTVISNLHLVGGHVTGADCASDGCGGAILLTGTARPTLARLLIENNSAHQGGGLWADPGPEVVIIDSKIISNSASHAGGGIYSESSVRLINTLVERNQSNDNGGGLDVVGALTVINGSIVSNTAALGGGGARVASVATLNFGRWEGNLAGGSQGGGLFASLLNMTGTLFINNEGKGGGGAYVNGPAVLQGGRFERNRSTSFGNGGGLQASDLLLSGTHFIGNTANGSSVDYGGGIYVSPGGADLNLVRIEDNQARGSGGGLWVSGPVTLTQATLLNNLADMGNGGAVYAGGSLLIKDSLLENNVSLFNSGGGAYAQGHLQIGTTEVVSNSASFRGGGAMGLQGAEVYNSQFLRNRGAQSGGGLDVEGPLGITSSVFISNTSNAGGGVFHSGFGDGRVVNALFARNSVSATGGVLQFNALTGVIDVIHVTMADPGAVGFNSAPAIYVESNNVNITNTLIADHAIGISNFNGIVHEDYNLFHNVGALFGGSVITGGHSLNPAVPPFVNPTNDNYHLQAGLEAVDSGTDAGVHFDIDGQPRPIGPGFDIGYDEYGYSIQLEIDQTAPGGAVFIPSGEYTESLTLYKPVSLIGVGQTPPIIHALPNQRVITITGAAITASTAISNVEFTGGDLMTTCTGECRGGGVFITDQAQPQLVDVNIHDNSAMMGGGVYVQSGSVTLVNVQLRRNRAGQSGGALYIEPLGALLKQIGGSVDDNQALDGAGVFVQAGQYQSTGTLISNNHAANWGGGVIIGGTGSARLDETTVSSNQAAQGGGVFIDLGSVELVNSTIFSNSADWGGGVYLLQPTAALTLTNSSLDSNHVITAGGGLFVQAGNAYLNSGSVQANQAEAGGGVFIDHGQVALSGGSIDNNDATYGGGVYLFQPGASFTQSSGTVDGNRASSGGGYYLNKGSAAVSGGTVSNNRAIFGGGLYINGGLIQLQAGASISGNTATAFGGGAYLGSPSAVLNQVGGAIQSNSAPSGGGVKITAGEYALWAGQVFQNLASGTGAGSGLGGGVMLDSAAANFVQRGGVVAGNTAQAGGGAYVLSGTATIGLGAAVYSNTATSLGGGLFLADGAVTLNGDVTNNRAQSGGGIYVDAPAALYTQQGLVKLNTATSGAGGGLYVNSGHAHIIGGQIISNTAGTDGGGLFVQPGGQATLLGGRVAGNTAVANGGGLYAWSSLVVTGTKFFNNTASDGGAIYHNGTDPGRISNVFVAGNSPIAANANGASVSLNSTGVVSMAYATFGNATNTAANVTGRAIGVHAGDVKIVNSIVASYSIGVSNTAGTVSEDYNLFFGTPVSLTGVISSGGHSREGFDPEFVDPSVGDYHLRLTSPAINRALDVGVRRDIDFDARPIGGGYDVGADETLGAGVVITPGGNVTTTLNYTNTSGGGTNVIIPPAALSGSITGTVSVYYTTISTASITTPLPSRLFLSGDPFELDAFFGDEVNATPIVTFSAPVTITLHYTESELGGISEQTLKLYRLEYPPFGSGWCAIGVCRPQESQTLDTVNNIITATVTGFSKWGKFGAQYPYDLFLPILSKN